MTNRVEHDLAPPDPGGSRSTDVDLIERARAGDGPALAGLIERLRDEVYRLSLRMLWHPEDAADATQEIAWVWRDAV